jgi:hypothetical protein
VVENKTVPETVPGLQNGAPAGTRTRDTRIRNPLLCPFLSYGGAMVSTSYPGFYGRLDQTGGQRFPKVPGKDSRVRVLGSVRLMR